MCEQKPVVVAAKYGFTCINKLTFTYDSLLTDTCMSELAPCLLVTGRVWHVFAPNYNISLTFDD